MTPIVLSIAACTPVEGKPEPLAADTDADADTDTDTDSDSDSDTGAVVARTLDTCETAFAEDVPTFFRTYFRCVSITMDGEDAVIVSDDLPPHPSSYYEEGSPNWEAWDDRGGDYRQNPNILSEQTVTVWVPQVPRAKGLTISAALVDREAGTSSDEYREYGMALDGTAYFHGVAAPGDDILEEQYSFDVWEGHPEMTGTYHHHSAAPGPLAVLERAGLTTSHTVGAAEIELFGVMCDGTFILGCTELDGSPADVADVDAQRGHAHDLVDADGAVHFAARYHVHLCTALDDRNLSPEIQYYDDCPPAPR